MNGETTEQSLADRLEARAPEPCDCGRCVIDDLRAAAARLRKLDRIKAALGTPVQLGHLEWELSDGPENTSPLVLQLTVLWLARLRDALEADDGA